MNSIQEQGQLIKYHTERLIGLVNEKVAWFKGEPMISTETKELTARIIELESELADALAWVRYYEEAQLDEVTGE